MELDQVVFKAPAADRALCRIVCGAPYAAARGMRHEISLYSEVGLGRGLMGMAVLDDVHEIGN